VVVTPENQERRNFFRPKTRKSGQKEYDYETDRLTEVGKYCDVPTPIRGMKDGLIFVDIFKAFNAGGPKE